MLVTTSWALDVLILTITLTITLYLYLARNNNYWKKRGIPYLKPLPFFGNVRDIFLIKKSLGDCCRSLYERSDKPYVGIFVCDDPYLLLRDPEVIKSILIKDFAYFMNRSSVNNKSDDPMGSHILFLMKKDDWRNMRRKITPVFTSGKMKLMHKLVLECSKDLVEHLEQRVIGDTMIETRDLCARYTTDTITSSAFGLNANCFKDESAPFRTASKRIFDWNSLARGFQMHCYFIAPFLVKLFRMQFIDEPSGKFLTDIFWKTMHEREKTNFVRNDLLDILLEITKKQDLNSDEYKLDGDKLVAQGVQFFIAGYETTSTTLSFALYEMALNSEIQNKLRKEIKEAKTKYGQLHYEALQEMKYLDMCIQETLRKYPALPFLDRRCTQDYVIPGTNHTILKGTGIYVPTMGLHYDPKYYPEPDKFIPERFTQENIQSRHICTYLPFGEGPRNCIGARFGLLSSKTGLAHIIDKFEVNICQKTQKEMKFEPNGFLIAPIKGLCLQFKKHEE